MAQDEIKAKQKVPEPTLRRLPWYLAYVKLLKGKGETVVSSTQISKVLSIEASQVVKDLSFVKIGTRVRARGLLRARSIRAARSCRSLRGAWVRASLPFRVAIA